MATVVDLFTYPVKGCAGTPLDSTHLTPAGLAHDRSFMVVSTDGVYRTQRRDPRLALVRPTISADGGRLTLASAERGAATAGTGFAVVTVFAVVRTSCTSTSPRPRPGATSTCSARRSRASTRARRQQPGSRTSWASRAGWSACRRSTTGRPMA